MKYLRFFLVSEELFMSNILERVLCSAVKYELYLYATMVG